MRPQPDSCGRTDDYMGTHFGWPLQWGRNLIVAEGIVAKRGDYVDVVSLQWGRNLIVAEGGDDGFGKRT